MPWNWQIFPFARSLVWEFESVRWAYLCYGAQILPRSLCLSWSLSYQSAILTLQSICNFRYPLCCVSTFVSVFGTMGAALVFWSNFSVGQLQCPSVTMFLKDIVRVLATSQLYFLTKHIFPPCPSGRRFFLFPFFNCNGFSLTTKRGNVFCCTYRSLRICSVREIWGKAFRQDSVPLLQPPVFPSQGL